MHGPGGQPPYCKPFKTRSTVPEGQEATSGTLLTIPTANRELQHCGGGSGAEALSLKLYKEQSLGYTDVICDGFYDLWDGLLSSQPNKPAQFPSLSQLLATPYLEDDLREVIVVDRSSDSKLRSLDKKAAKLLRECQNQASSGALACLQVLSRLVSDTMGGAASHEELLNCYRAASKLLKRERQSLVLPIGEMKVGLSRHRALLLKALADASNLPCQILRGETYLGVAEKDGQDSTVMMQFHGKEWMVELVTQPGRLYQVCSGTVLQPSKTSLWVAPQRSLSEGSARDTPLSTFRGFPISTNSGAGPDRAASRASGSTGASSSRKRSVLAWSEQDGPIMESLDDLAEAMEPTAYSVSTNLHLTSQQQHAELHELQSLRPRLSCAALSVPSSEPGSAAAPITISAVATSSKRGGRQPEDISSSSIGLQDFAREGSRSLPNYLPFTSGEHTSEAEWASLPWEERPLLEVHHSMSPDSHAGTWESATPRLSYSGPDSARARARVCGRDSMGRMIELKLEGLTVTHAHNLDFGQPLVDLPRPHEKQRPQESSSDRAKSLDTSINRYKGLEPNTAKPGRASEGTPATPQSAFSRAGAAASGSPTLKPGGFPTRPEIAVPRPAMWDSAKVSSGPSLAPFNEGALIPAPPSHPGASEASTANSSFVAPKAPRVLLPEEAENLTLELLSNSQKSHLAVSAAAEAADPADSLSTINNPDTAKQAQAAPGKPYTLNNSTPRSILKPVGTLAGGSTKQATAPEGNAGPTLSAGLALESSTSSSVAVSSGADSIDSIPTIAEKFRMASEANLAETRARGESPAWDPRTRDYYSCHGAFNEIGGLASTMQTLNHRRRQVPANRVLEGHLTQTPTVAVPAELAASLDETSVPAPEVDDAEVDFAEIELGPRIGIGCFGEVFKAHWRHTTVAVKRLFEQSLSDTTLKEFRAEVQMNRRLKHPNVVQFLGACLKPPNLSIVTQFAPKGSLYHLLHSDEPGRPRLTDRRKLKMALDIARGMHYLHSARPPVIHRDLKSMNLLVDNDFSIKVCDFGLARTRSSTWMTGRSQGGTPEWTAPEVLRHGAYNEKSDIWSYGVVLYELATEEEPWEGMNPMQVVGAVGWCGDKLDPPPNCLPVFADLMQRCFQAPEQRPDFQTIIKELIQHANATRSARVS